jgi:hypothetical protein
LSKTPRPTTTSRRHDTRHYIADTLCGGGSEGGGGDGGGGGVGAVVVTLVVTEMREKSARSGKGAGGGGEGGGGECGGESDPDLWLLTSDEEEVRGLEMKRQAIRGHPRSSEVIACNHLR